VVEQEIQVVILYFLQLHLPEEAVAANRLLAAQGETAALVGEVVDIMAARQDC
jgi:hypothetical protein